MAIKVYSPTDFEDTSSGVSIDGNLVVDTSVLYIDTANDRVGVGTTSPGNLLHIVASSNNASALIIQDDARRLQLGRDMIEARSADGSTVQNLYIQPDGNTALATTSGNVGIGTTGPGYKLEVTANARIGARLTLNSSSYRQHIALTRSGQGYYLTQSGNTALVEAIGSTDRFDIFGSIHVKTSGNIGIGTSSPGSKLQVYSTASSNIFISGHGTQAQNTWGAEHAFFTSAGQGVIVGKANAGNDTNRLHILYNTSNGDAQYLGYDTNNNNKVKLNTNGNSHLNGGNVGIGTTSPSKKLHVAGDTFIQQSGTGQTLLLGRTIGQPTIKADSSSSGHLVLDSDAGEIYLNNYVNKDVYIATGGGSVGVGTTAPVTKLHVYDSTATAGLSIQGGNTFSSDLNLGDSDDINIGRIKYDHTNDSMQFQINNAERLRITSSGNVGIGTTSPTAKLHVQGTSYFFDQSIFSDKVGIGTTSPAYKLDVSVASQHVARFTSTTADNGGLIINKSNASYNPNILLQAGGNTKWYILNASNDSDKFQLYESTGTTPRFTLTQGGNVGIGTASPERLLSLYSDNVETTPRFLIEQDGTGDAVMAFSLTGGQGWSMGIDNSGGDSFNIHNSAGGVDSSSQFTILNSGNVGIGTTSPSVKLDVNGPFKASTIYDSEYLNAGNTDWRTKKFVRSLGISGGSISGTWVHLSTVSLSSSYHKATLKFKINGYDDVTSGNESINVRYENGSSAQEGHNCNWYTTDDFANIFSEVRSIRSSSSGLSNTYDLYVKMAGDWRDTFTVEVEYWKYGATISFPTTNATATTPTAGSNDIARTTRDWQTENNYVTAGSFISTGIAYAGTGYQHWGNGGTGMLFPSNDNISFQTGGNDRLYINSSGNVGIGTTNMYARLNVKATSHNNGISVNRAADNTAALYIGNDGGGSPILAANNADMLFGRDFSGTFTERMRLTNGGNLLIGTTTDNSYKLDVIGVTRFDGATISGIIGSDPAALVIEEDQFIYTNDGSSANPRKLIGKKSDIIEIGEGGTSLIDGISLLPGSNGLVRVYTGGTEYVRFDGVNQRVGIGTTAPDYKLEVQDNTSGIATIQVRNTEGSDGSGAGIRLYTTTNTHGNKPVYIKNIPDATGGALVINSRAADNSYSDTFYISGAGDVGIGTTSPSKKLDIVASDSDGVKVSGGTNGRYIEVTSSNLDFYTTSVSGYGMSNLVRKNSDGSVLGQISGAYGGDPNILTYTYYGGTAYNNAAMYILSSNKNVGIGTTSPQQKLHIVGNVRLNSAGERLEFQNSNVYITRSGNEMYMAAYSGWRFYDTQGSSTRMLLTNGGNVLINTTTDSGERLQVSGTARIEGDLSFSSQVGTWITSNVMPDSIGWNTNYGVYIGSNVGGTHYLRGNGTFTTGGNTYNLWHAGNDGASSGLDADLLDGNHASAFYLASNPSGYATQTYVNTAVSNLVDSAPGTLDTLNELAAALGDDPNFATTVTNSIATKLPLAGGTMTGDLSMNGNDIWNVRSIQLANREKSDITVAYQILADANDSSAPALLGTYTSSHPEGLYFRDNSNTLTYTIYHTGHFSGTHISNWQTAYSWGDHGTAGYALSTDLSAYLPLSGGTLGGPLTINGSLTVNGTITENSSLRVKENIITSEGHLEKVNKLRPVKYNKIDSDKTEIGLIAEEVEEVYPEFIQYDENGEPVGVHYSRLTAALIGAVKELNNRLEKLENK